MRRPGVPGRCEITRARVICWQLGPWETTPMEGAIWRYHLSQRGVPPFLSSLLLPSSPCQYFPLAKPNRKPLTWKSVGVSALPTA